MEMQIHIDGYLRIGRQDFLINITTNEMYLRLKCGLTVERSASETACRLMRTRAGYR